jgi:hypothetical protein
MVKTPAELVETVLVTSVDSFTADTAVLATTKPDGSCTLPVMAPVPGALCTKHAGC